MKEKKRRDKEAKTKYGSAPGLMMQCVSQSSQDEIPQTDGPADSPAATSHMSNEMEAADDSTDESAEQSFDTETDAGEKYIFKENGCPNVCITCPIFPTTWCSEEHKCVTAQAQLAAISMDVTDIPPCSYCGLIGMHTCDNDNCKRIPNLELC